VIYWASSVEWQVCLVRARLMVVMNGNVVEVLVGMSMTRRRGSS
jgi:hypothetical protein